MADVAIVPQIRCDNCGLTAEKETSGTKPDSYGKPRRWGSLTIHSGRGQSGYPSEFLKFVDLCPSCAMGAHDAAAARLADLRGELRRRTKGEA